MAQPAKKQPQDFHRVPVEIVTEQKSVPTEAFSKASHFGWALLPMWVGVTYLFIKNMVRLSMLTISVAPAGSARHVSLDDSILAQIVMLGLFYFGVGFALRILRAIRKVSN